MQEAAWECVKCGCELSFTEMRSGELLRVCGGLYDTSGMCYQCAGDLREKLGVGRAYRIVTRREAGEAPSSHHTGRDCRWDPQ